MDMRSITTLTFDCYGTMIDWESGIWDGLQMLLRANGSNRTRHQTLEDFARVESALQAQTPSMIYPEILAQTHRELARQWGYETTDALDRRFGDFVPYWNAFADSADALRQLGSVFNLVILSNVDRASFAASQDRLGVTFDAIYTAQDVGSYKPHDQNFPFMLAGLAQDHNISSDQILHVAQSLFHDVVPATKVGLPTAWIDRQDLAGGGSWGATAKVDGAPEPAMRFPSLQAFADWAVTAKQAS